MNDDHPFIELERMIRVSLKKQKTSFLLRVHSMMIFYRRAVPFLKKLGLLQDFVDTVPDFDKSFCKLIIQFGVDYNGDQTGEIAVDPDIVDFLMDFDVWLMTHEDDILEEDV